MTQRGINSMSMKAPLRGFPGGLDSKASTCNVGDLGSIPVLGRSPGEGNGNLLQYSCLENSTDGGAWWATVHGVAKSQIQLSNFTQHLRSQILQWTDLEAMEFMLPWESYLNSLYLLI